MWVNATELEALNIGNLLKLQEDIGVPCKTLSREDLLKEIQQALALAEMFSKPKSQKKLVRPN